MRSVQLVSVAVVVVSVLAVVASAANPTGPFFVQGFFSSSGCAPAASTSFAAYPSNVCQQTIDGSSKFDCSDLTNPTQISYTTSDCTGASTSVSGLNSSCSLNTQMNLWLTSGCVADLSTLFFGSALALKGFKNTSECASGLAISYTVSTAPAACTPISNAGSIVATTAGCNATHSYSLYCYDSSCSNCMEQATQRLNETCSDAGTIQTCIMGATRPNPPVSSGSAPAAATTPVTAAPKSNVPTVVRAPSSASSLWVSASLVIVGCAIALFA